MPRSVVSERYQLGDCSCLRLRKMARRVTQLYDQIMAPAGLSVTQFGLLAHAWFLKDVSVSELGEHLVMDPSTVTRNLRPLVDRGWVELKVSARDRRQREVHLTKAGATVLGEARPYWVAAQRQLRDMLGDQRATLLNDALDTALDRLLPA